MVVTTLGVGLVLGATLEYNDEMGIFFTLDVPVWSSIADYWTSLPFIRSVTIQEDQTIIDVVDEQLSEEESQNILNELRSFERQYVHFDDHNMWQSIFPYDETYYWYQQGQNWFVLRCYPKWYGGQISAVLMTCDQSSTLIAQEDKSSIAPMERIENEN